ncbi:MAG: hypothetical protein WDN28_07545 [Chthoniobacter sp.]
MTASLRAIWMVALAVGAFTPVSARAHSTDFILVKVTPHDGRIEVELTADYGGNPMFSSEADAHSVLTKVLRVEARGQTRELVALAPLRFERRKQFDPTAPIPLDPAGSAEGHQLLCASWSWKCGAETVTFEMPEDAGQSVILWTPPQAPDQQARWVFLLPGEHSPAIHIPARSMPSWLGASLAVGFVGVSTRICFGLISKGSTVG